MESNKEMNTYTWKEIAQHNTNKSAWVYIDDDVYDVTSFLPRHPGGEDMILLMAGRDVTDLFPSYHPFTTKPKQILSKFHIGKLKGPSEFGVFEKDSGFYTTLRERVGKYFADNNLDYKYPYSGLWRYLLITSCIFGFWYLAWNTKNILPLYVRFLFMIMAGIAQGLLLIHTMHDCSHTSLSHMPLVWKLLGRICMDVTCGTSFDAWLHQHVVGHHVYTNVLMIDPDVPMQQDGDIRRIMPQQAYSSQYKFQYIYLPILYSIYAFKNRIQDLTQTLFGAYNGAMRVNPHFRDNECLIRQLVTKIVWLIRAVYVPIFVWKNDFFNDFLLLFLTMELTTGYFLTYNFQVSHVSTDLEWPQPIHKDGKIIIPGEWAKLQIETCLDYGHSSWWCTFFSGALNYQTVHHLFPAVSQYHYPQIAPIIKETCKEYGVKFNHVPSFTHAFYLHIKQLYDMGKHQNVKKLD